MRSLLALAGLLLVAAPAAAQPAAPADTTVRSAVTMPELVGGLGALVQGLGYPPDALAAGAEGRVIVRFFVTEAGAVEDAEVFRPVHPALDEAALEAVRRARFRPARRDGRAVRVRLALPITFELPAGRPD